MAKICNVNKCTKKSHGLGLCNAHYKRFKKYGDVNHLEQKRKYQTIEERFVNSFTKVNNSCWIWNGAFGSTGYGAMTWEGIRYDAHRFSFEFFNKVKLGKEWVLHKCDNPSCVNPSHLFLGDANLNSKDMVAKKRQAYGVKSNKNKLTENDVREIRVKLKNGLKGSVLSKEYNVSESCISKIKHQIHWRYAI